MFLEHLDDIKLKTVLNVFKHIDMMQEISDNNQVYIRTINDLFYIPQYLIILWMEEEYDDQPIHNIIQVHKIEIDRVED